MDYNKVNSPRYFLDLFVSFILAFTMPILAWIFSLKYIYKRGFSYVLWIICFFFGLTMDVDDPVYDSYRYKLFFFKISWFNGDFNRLLLYIRNSGDIDFYQIFSSFIVSSFTENHHFYFAFLALIYGYFYSKNIYLVFSNTKFGVKKGLFFFFLAFVFIFVQPIWYIEGARFWTASQIFIYVILNEFFFKRKKYFLLAVTPFFHVSFLIPILFFLLAKFSLRFFDKLILRVSVVLFVLSIVFSFSSFEGYFVKILSYFSESIAYRIEYYTSVEYKKIVDSFEFSLIGYLLEIVKKVTYVLIYIYILKEKNYFFKNKNLKYFYLFTILFFSLVSFIGIIPIVDRFVYVGFYFLLLLYFIRLCDIPGLKIEPLILIINGFLFLHICNVILRGRPFFSQEFLFAPYYLLKYLIF